MNNLEFQNSLDRIKGLTVAIVYIFEGSRRLGLHITIYGKEILFPNGLMPLQMSDATFYFRCKNICGESFLQHTSTH